MKVEFGMTWLSYGRRTIEIPNELSYEDCIEYIKDKLDEIPLPDESDYVRGSDKLDGGQIIFYDDDGKEVKDTEVSELVPDFGSICSLTESEDQDMKYFEVEFSNGDGDPYMICIRGLREPTIEEANVFYEKDSKVFGKPVTNIFPIDEDEARDSYDFENEEQWPIFK